MPEHDLIPNFTQFPNKLMDYVIPLLRESEEKVLIYVLRCTYGYRDQDGKQKEQDYISYSQFLHGQVSREGNIVNFGAGVSRASLADALAFHQATGLIERLDPAAGKRNAGRGSTGLYRFNRHCELVQFLNQCLQDPDTARERLVQFLNQKRLLVQKVNQSEKKPKKDKPVAKNGSESKPLKNGSEFEPEMVQNLNLPNKEKERTKEDPPISPKSAPTKKSRERKVQCLCPEDYQPSAQVVQRLRDDYPGADIPRLVRSMKNWSASKGEMRRDWDATLRTFADHETPHVTQHRSKTGLVE